MESVEAARVDPGREREREREEERTKNEQMSTMSYGAA
jgi:hypothetical protein